MQLKQELLDVAFLPFLLAGGIFYEERCKIFTGNMKQVFAIINQVRPVQEA